VPLTRTDATRYLRNLSSSQGAKATKQSRSYHALGCLADVNRGAFARPVGLQ